MSRLLNEDEPALDTIKMQVYFDMNYTNRNDFLEEHRRVLEMRLQPIVREITDSRARTRDELEGELIFLPKNNRISNALKLKQNVDILSSLS